jgi:hypothetical protein
MRVTADKNLDLNLRVIKSHLKPIIVRRCRLQGQGHRAIFRGIRFSMIRRLARPRCAVLAELCVGLAGHRTSWRARVDDIHSSSQEPHGNILHRCAILSTLHMNETPASCCHIRYRSANRNLLGANNGFEVEEELASDHGNMRDRDIRD